MWWVWVDLIDPAAHEDLWNKEGGRYCPCLCSFPEKWRQYERLAVEQRIAQQEYQAAEMRRDAAYGWHGAYGAGVYGPGAYGPVRYGAIRR